MNTRNYRTLTTDCDIIEQFLDSIKFSNIELFNLAEAYFSNRLELKLIVLDSIKYNFKNKHYSLYEINKIYEDYVQPEIHVFSKLPSLALIMQQRELVHSKTYNKEQVLEREYIVEMLQDTIKRLDIDVYFYPELEEENEGITLVDNFPFTLFCFAQDIACHLAKKITKIKQKLNSQLEQSANDADSDYFKATQNLLKGGAQLPYTCFSLIYPKYQLDILPDFSLIFSILTNKLQTSKIPTSVLSKKLAEQFLNSINDMEFFEDNFYYTDSTIGLLSNTQQSCPESTDLSLLDNIDCTDELKSHFINILNPLKAYKDCKSPCNACKEFRVIVGWNYSDPYLYTPRNLATDIITCSKTRNDKIHRLHILFSPTNSDGIASRFSYFLFNSLKEMYSLPDIFVKSPKIIDEFSKVLNGRVFPKFWKELKTTEFLNLLRNHIDYIKGHNQQERFSLSSHNENNQIDWSTTNKMLLEIRLYKSIQLEEKIAPKLDTEDFNPNTNYSDEDKKLDRLLSIEEMTEFNGGTDENIGTLRNPNFLTALLISTYIYLLFLIVSNDINQQKLYSGNILDTIINCIAPGELKTKD